MISLRKGTLASAVLVLAALIGGCTREDAAAKRSGPPPVAVAAAPARVEDVPVTVKAIGSVEPYRTVAVRARIGGELTRVAFEEGQDVRAGDVLFTIDSRPYMAALRQAEADLERDRARAASARAEVTRYADLVGKDYVTRQQYDDVRANAAALDATIAADSAAVDAARLNVAYCTITAPISGRTGNLMVHPGNLVSASASGASSSSPLVTINQISPVYVSFSVPERDLAQIRRFASEGTLRTEVWAPSDSNRVVTGDLTFIDNAVDPATGTILLKATFANQDHALWPGQFVNAALALSIRRNAVVVPASAVQTGQDGEFVYVVKPDMTVEMRSVIPGTRRDSEIVVERGVQAEEIVVTDGQLRLTPNARVSIKGAGSRTAGAAAGPGAAAGAPETAAASPAAQGSSR